MFQYMHRDRLLLFVYENKIISKSRFSNLYYFILAKSIRWIFLGEQINLSWQLAFLKCFGNFPCRKFNNVDSLIGLYFHLTFKILNTNLPRQLSCLRFLNYVIKLVNICVRLAPWVYPAFPMCAKFLNYFCEIINLVHISTPDITNGKWNGLSLSWAMYNI